MELGHLQNEILLSFVNPKFLLFLRVVFLCAFYSVTVAFHTMLHDGLLFKTILL